jgi:hypothetical protein
VQSAAQFKKVFEAPISKMWFPSVTNNYGSHTYLDVKVKPDSATASTNLTVNNQTEASNQKLKQNSKIAANILKAKNLQLSSSMRVIKSTMRSANSTNLQLEDPLKSMNIL